MATSPTMPAVSSSEFLKLLTKFHKIQLIEIFQGLRTTRPKKAVNSGAMTRRHAPPQIYNDPRSSHSNLRESEENFTKLMQPFDPAGPDLQNMKISGPKDQPRPDTRHQKIRRSHP